LAEVEKYATKADPLYENCPQKIEHEKLVRKLSNKAMMKGERGCGGVLQAFKLNRDWGLDSPKENLGGIPLSEHHQGVHGGY